MPVPREHFFFSKKGGGGVTLHDGCSARPEKADEGEGGGTPKFFSLPNFFGVNIPDME